MLSDVVRALVFAVGLFHLGASKAQVCENPLPCPVPSAGQSCFSGQLLDLETSEPIREDSASGAVCSEVASDGPCSVAVTPYDALAFYQNPLGAAPLSASVVIDDCGRYLISELPVPGLGFVSLAVHDAPPNDQLRTSSATSAVSDGQQTSGFRLYAIRVSTDAAWTASAGSPFGAQTFSDTGVFVSIFLTSGFPGKGTVPTRLGTAQPDDDYFFSDINPFARTTINSGLAETGNNGTALMVNSQLVDHSGTGGELSGCEWPTMLGTSPQGLVVVQEFHLHDQTSNNLCPQLFFSHGFESCEPTDADCPHLRGEYWTTYAGVPDASGTECNDGVDNDADELLDMDDPGCDSPCDISEDLAIAGTKPFCVAGDIAPVVVDGEVIECIFDADSGSGNDADCLPAPGSDCWGCFNGYNTILGEFCDPDYSCFNNGCSVCNELGNPGCTQTCSSCQETCDGIDNDCDAIYDEGCTP